MTLAANAEDLHGLAVSLELIGETRGFTNDRAVECTAKSAVTGKGNQQLDLVVAGAGQQARCTFNAVERACQ